MAGVGRFGTRAWSELGGDPALLERVAPPARPVPLPSHLAVGELAADSVAVASLALAAAGAARSLGRPPRAEEVARVQVDPARVAASYRSERLFRLDGDPPKVWGDLSGFWPCADGWVRTHANYPHHDARLRAVLGLHAAAGAEEMRTALSARAAQDLEDAAAQAGAVLVRVRHERAWRAHPQARALAGRPLVVTELLGDAPARSWPGGAGAAGTGADPARPLAGVRVLDLTRVIAGPVATRDLALAGADVLRVDTPHTPEIAFQHLDTGQGKRSTVLHLSDPAGLDALEQLLGSADVVVTGYRPGALDRFGLAPEQLAERHPGLVTARISAWDTVGPWAGRRGFDSIVQAASRIGLAESADGVTPGALPAQALDHSAGHLLAAAVAAALVRQRTEGGSRHVAVALARVGLELLDQPGRTAGPADADDPLPVLTGSGPAGTVTCAVPPLAWDGAPAAYAWVGRPWGADEPRWA